MHAMKFGRVPDMFNRPGKPKVNFINNLSAGRSPIKEDGSDEEDDIGDETT